MVSGSWNEVCEYNLTNLFLRLKDQREHVAKRLKFNSNFQRRLFNLVPSFSSTPQTEEINTQITKKREQNFHTQLNPKFHHEAMIKFSLFVWSETLPSPHTMLKATCSVLVVSSIFACLLHLSVHKYLICNKIN